MRIRRKKWVEPELESCKFHVKDPKMYLGKWENYFLNKQPIYLELGCGRGNFVANFGVIHKDINIIAIDIKSQMLGLAKRKIESIYQEKNEQIDNILLTAYNIEQILDILGEEDKIQRIYINFCNPWPRVSHKKRRLTYKTQLEKYKVFLINDGEVYFKTDDDGLFADSLKYFQESGFIIVSQTYDLHKEKDIENIITEHEKMFDEKGIKIKALIAKRSGLKD